ncbi:cytochrome c oxidase subunit II [Planctomycetota bacterium]
MPNCFLPTFLFAQVELPPSPIAPGDATVWMPPQVTTNAASTDIPFYFIYWIGVFFFVLIVGILLFLAVRYGRRYAGEKAGKASSHNTTIELVWTFIPLILVFDMFYLGFQGYSDVSTPPADAMEIYVSGRKWSWSFTYPNGHTDNELHVPVDKPVRLIMDSADVIHSFFIPAFRVKKDVVPGRYTHAWFECTTPGEYIALCAEYCGTDHSNMWARVIVHEEDGYEKWLAEASDPFQSRTVVEVGELMYRKYVCHTCHTNDGTRKTGPSFKGLFGRDTALTDGQSVVADENYIKESVVNPQAAVVVGFPPVMPTYKGLIKDKELNALIEYIKTLE